MFWLVVVVGTVLIGIVFALLSNIDRNGSMGRCQINGVEQLGFVVKETLVQFPNGGRNISAFNLINNRFVLFWKTLKDEIYLIFMIQWFAKNGKLVKTCGDALKVNINSLGFFLPVFELSLELFDMSTAGLCIGRCKRGPSFLGSCCSRHERLERRRDGTNESTVDYLVLAFLGGELRIDRDLIINSEGRCRNDGGSVNMARQLIAIKEGMNLQAPHQVICRR